MNPQPGTFWLYRLFPKLMHHLVQLCQLKTSMYLSDFFINTLNLSNVFYFIVFNFGDISVKFVLNFTHIAQ